MILNEYATENILQEQYYGKNKQLEEVDKLFNRAIEITNYIHQDILSKDIGTISRLNKEIAPRMENIIKNYLILKKFLLNFSL